MIWWIYFGIVALQLAITYPRFSQTCNSSIGYPVYLLHHFLDVFVFWGFLFMTTKAEFRIHLVVITLIVIHWFTNNYECILTTEMNRMCGYPRKQWLDSIVDRIRPTYYTHTVWVVLVGIYDIMIFQGR
jgi:hypothetical protein